MTLPHDHYRSANATNSNNMEKFLRDWRQDALNKHQYDSAIFIGDKLLALTRMLLSDFLL
jgi:hypothetical protein